MTSGFALMKKLAEDPTHDKPFPSKPSEINLNQLRIVWLFLYLFTVFDQIIIALWIYLRIQRELWDDFVFALEIDDELLGIFLSLILY